MKKTTILLLLIIFACFRVSIAQVHLDSANAELHVVGDLTSLHSSHVKIINTGSSSLGSVVVQRNIISLAASHSCYFCWGINCYGPGTSLSPTPEAIAANDTNSTFVGYLSPGNSAGTSVVEYCFYDNTGNSDTICVTFTYEMVTGINDLNPNAFSVSSAYPNPANSLTSISYNISSTKDARLVFYNMLGSIVKDIVLTEKQSTLIITTSDLRSGVYFYSLVADGKSLASKKLIVSHR